MQLCAKVPALSVNKPFAIKEFVVLMFYPGDRLAKLILCFFISFNRQLTENHDFIHFIISNFIIIIINQESLLKVKLNLKATVNNNLFDTYMF